MVAHPYAVSVPPDCIGLTRSGSINGEAMARTFADLINPHPLCIMERPQRAAAAPIMPILPPSKPSSSNVHCTQWKPSELCVHHMNWAAWLSGIFIPYPQLFAIWVTEQITSNSVGWINFRVDIRLRTCNADRVVVRIYFHSVPAFCQKYHSLASWLISTNTDMHIILLMIMIMSVIIDRHINYHHDHQQACGESISSTLGQTFGRRDKH